MKKLLSAVLAGTMMMSAVSVVFADSELETVVKGVKSKLDIPENLTEFTVSTGTDDGEKEYFLNWSVKDEDRDKEEYQNQFLNYYVTATKDAEIKSIYANYNYKDWNNSIVPSFSKDEAVKFGEQFLKNLGVDAVLDYVDANSSSYSLSYKHMENGIEVVDDGINMEVEKLNDKLYVTNYNCDWSDIDAKVPENAMGEDGFKKYISENSPLELNYHDVYNRKRGQILQYSVNKGENTYFDAQTGEQVEKSYDIWLAGNEGAAGSMDASAGGANKELTEVEIAEIAKVNNLISGEELEKYIKSIDELGIAADLTMASESIRNYDGAYYADINLADKDKKNFANVEINAQTKEILSFYRYSIDKEDKPAETPLTDEQVQSGKAKVDEFLKKYYGDKYAQLKYEDCEKSNIDDNLISHNVTYQYCRTINGVPYYNNTVRINYNGDTGKIEYLYFNWRELKDIPSADGAISLEKATENLLALPVKQVWVKNSDKKYVLAYTFDGETNFDAKTGENMKYNGKSVDVKFGGYTDIDGHWAKDMANALADADIYLDGTEFKPEMSITQYEYLRLLAMSEKYIDINEEDIYNYAISRKIISKDEKNPTAVLTKEQAVKYLLKARGYSEVAELQGIFKTGFADENAIGADSMGYVAIAKGLGIVTGDENGNFNPQKELTRAEAVSVIYKAFVR